MSETVIDHVAAEALFNDQDDSGFNSGWAQLINQMPIEWQDWVLVPWREVAKLLGVKDVKHAKEVLRAAGVPIVMISERKCMPRWGKLREFISNREIKAP